MSSRVCQPGERSCSVVCCYGRGHFRIFCKMAAGRTATRCLPLNAWPIPPYNHANIRSQMQRCQYARQGCVGRQWMGSVEITDYQRTISKISPKWKSHHQQSHCCRGRRCNEIAVTESQSNNAEKWHKYGICVGFKRWDVLEGHYISLHWNLFFSYHAQCENALSMNIRIRILWMAKIHVIHKCY